MNAIELIAQDLFDKVRSRFSNLQMGDETGAVTINPTEARFFDFDFVVEGNNLGRVSVSINDLGNLKLFYSQGIVEDHDPVTQDFWFNFLREMRQFAKRRLLRFDTRDITKGNLEKNDFQYLAVNGSKEDNMTESQMYGSSKSSYRPLEKTLLIIRHNTKVGEDRGARSRPNNIKSVFIQNEAGERFKYPFVHLAGAKAMQRHVANGGMPYDEAGTAIIKMSETIRALSTFKRQVGNAEQLTQEAVGIVDRASSKLATLRSMIENLSKQTHYESWRENLENVDLSEQSELDPATLEDYKSKFTISHYKEDLTQYFPLLYSIMRETSEIDLEDYVGEEKEEMCDACDEPVSHCGCDDHEETKESLGGRMGYYVVDRFSKDPTDGPFNSPQEAQQANHNGGSVVQYPIDDVGTIRDGRPVTQRSPSAEFEAWADKVAMEVFDDDESEKIQHLMRKYGWSRQEAMEYLHYEKHDPKDWDDFNEGNAVDEAGSPEQQAAIAINKKSSSVEEGAYQDLGPNGREIYAKVQALRDKIRSGEITPNEKMQSQFDQLLVGAGMDPEFAEREWNRITGNSSTPTLDPKYKKSAPPISAPGAGDDDEDDDASFLQKLRMQAKGGSIQQGADTGEVDEEMEETNIHPAQIAELVLPHIDRETGGCPLGATGVGINIKKQTGSERAGKLAEKLVHHLQAKYQAESESRQQMESMRRLAGLPPLAEAKKEKEPEGNVSSKRFETDSQRVARLAKEKMQAKKKARA